jgi:hypothetical protein
MPLLVFANRGGSATTADRMGLSLRSGLLCASACQEASLRPQAGIRAGDELAARPDLGRGAGHSRALHSLGTRAELRPSRRSDRFWSVVLIPRASCGPPTSRMTEARAFGLDYAMRLRAGGFHADISRPLDRLEGDLDGRPLRSAARHANRPSVSRFASRPGAAGSKPLAAAAVSSPGPASAPLARGSGEGIVAKGAA